MKLGRQPRKWLDKKRKLGFRGYPVGTIAFYGPDDQRASKVAVAVIVAPDTEPVALRRWFAESGDIRNDVAILEEVALFLRDHEARSVAMTEGIFGCPHEEGSIIRKASPVRFVRSGPVATAHLSYSSRHQCKLLVASFVIACSGSHVTVRPHREQRFGSIMRHVFAMLLPKRDS